MSRYDRVPALRHSAVARRNGKTGPDWGVDDVLAKRAKRARRPAPKRFARAAADQPWRQYIGWYAWKLYDDGRLFRYGFGSHVPATEAGAMAVRRGPDEVPAIYEVLTCRVENDDDALRLVKWVETLAYNRQIMPDDSVLTWEQIQEALAQEDRLVPATE